MQPGDQVWLSTTNLKMLCPSRKLAPRFVGPFPVRRKINDVSFELTLPESFKIHPVFHVSLLKPVVPDPFPDHRPGPPAPIIIDGDEEFEVEAVLDCRKRRGQTQYLIKWKGYGPEENSWEPARNVHATDLIRAFFRSNPQKRNRLGTRRLPVGRGQCQGRQAFHVSARRARMRTSTLRHTPVTNTEVRRAI